MSGAGESGSALRAMALTGLPLVKPGDDLAALIRTAAGRQGVAIGPGDIVVVAQKIVSKAEGRIRRLAEVRPGARAMQMALECGRPPALVQLILDESTEILRAHPAAIIARHRSGHILANAGIDASNVGPENAGNAGDASVLLWPEDADASARRIRSGLSAAGAFPAKVGTGFSSGNATKQRSGASPRYDRGGECSSRPVPAVVVADSLGRAWRLGTLGTAIGVAGLAVLDDRRGQKDLFGRSLQATVIAVADAVAGAAVLAMGEGSEGTPVAIVSGGGAWVSREDGPGAVAGLRPVEQDMFR